MKSAIVAIAAVAGIAMPMALHAQDLPKTISPLQVEEDRNGVNVATGKMQLPALTLSVPGSSRLKFDYVQNAAPYVTGRRQTLTAAGDDLTAQYTVHTAEGSSEAFRCNWAVELGAEGKACASVNGSGSMLIYNGTDYRRAGSGERYTLNVVFAHTQTNQNGNPNQEGVSTYYASKIEYPDGEVLTYSYDTGQIQSGASYPITYYRRRPNRISTNLGYFITIAYSQTDPTQNDWGNPIEAAIYSNSAPSTPIQKFTYSGNMTTDITGRQYVGFGAGGIGFDLEVATGSQTLPTEASPNLTVAPKNGLPQGGAMVGSVTRDGVQ